MTSSQLDAIQKKENMYINAKGRCAFCGKRLTLSDAQLAHRIPKTKANLASFGPEVIHHEKNMLLTCAKCNSKALLSFASHPIEAAALIDEIREELAK